MFDYSNSQLKLGGLRLDHGRYELVSMIGTGAYGVVYAAVDNMALQRQTTCTLAASSYVAIKCLRKMGQRTRQRHFQLREISLHQLATGHESIVTVHKIVEDAHFTYIIMDVHSGGDLFAMITDRKRYLGDEELIRSVFLQIIDAVAYCHSLGIFHRDLKPENILCSEDGTQVYLADFGLATTAHMSTDFFWLVVFGAFHRTGFATLNSQLDPQHDLSERDTVCLSPLTFLRQESDTDQVN